jgi:hypothetical protein
MLEYYYDERTPNITCKNRKDLDNYKAAGLGHVEVKWDRKFVVHRYFVGAGLS